MINRQKLFQSLLFRGLVPTFRNAGLTSQCLPQTPPLPQLQSWGSQHQAPSSLSPPSCSADGSLSPEGLAMQTGG